MSKTWGFFFGGSGHGSESSCQLSAYYKVFPGLHVFRGGGGTTRPLPRDGGAEELRGDPTVGPHPKVWTID